MVKRRATVKNVKKQLTNMLLKEHYIKNIIPAMKKKFGYSNDLAVPRIKKIVVNVGLGKALKDDRYKETAARTLTAITGQKPLPTRARKSIAGFGIREGMVIGIKVTLRGRQMYDFLTKLIHISLPRVRDFQGLNPKSLDKNGNVTIGFKEHTVFPEITIEDAGIIHGLEVVIETNAKNDTEALELFKLLKFPFQKE